MLTTQNSLWQQASPSPCTRYPFAFSFHTQHRSSRLSRPRWQFSKHNNNRVIKFEVPDVLSPLRDSACHARPSPHLYASSTTSQGRSSLATRSVSAATTPVTNHSPSGLEGPRTDWPSNRTPPRCASRTFLIAVMSQDAFRSRVDVVARAAKDSRSPPERCQSG